MELMIKEKEQKKTVIGSIPPDWISTKFNEVIDKFSSGATPYRRVSAYYKGENLWVSSSELNYGIINDTKEKITDEAIRKTNLHKHPEGTFLIAITGLEAAGTRGRCGILGVEATTNQSCMALYPNKDKLLTEYLFYFYSLYGDFLAFNYCQGTKQQSYTAGIVRILPINLPPTLKEQQAISEALSDVDELIRSLDRLIQKKQAIKKGTMQQLLTGKKRLPGFDGEWEVKKLGDIGNTFNGLSGKRKADFGDGNHPYITFLNVMNNTVIDTSIFDTVKVRSGESQSEVKNGDLLFNTSSETPEEVGMCSVLLDSVENLHLNSFCFGYRIHEQDEVFPIFLAYYFRSEFGRKHMQALAQGSTRYNLSKSKFVKIEIELPEFDEQKAIAQILSEMDRELQTLRQKREKYKQIKQGMMQELLTGKTRLV